MRKLQYGIILWGLSMVLVLGGCRLRQNLDAVVLRPLPESYGGSADAGSVARVGWRDFFQDPYLVALIDTALAQNLDAAMALQKIELMRAEVYAAKGTQLPELSLGVGVSRRKFGLYTMDGAGNITTEMRPGELIPIHLPDYKVGVQASWEIDLWGKYRYQRKAATARFLGSLEGQRLVVTELVGEVASTYYALVSLDQSLRIVQETIVLLNDALAAMRVQKEAGRVNELALAQFEAEALSAQALELEMLNAIAVGENRMNFLLGRYPQAVVRIDSLLPDALPMQLAVGVPSDLLAYRPDVVQAEMELIASKADVAAAKAAFYPSLSITGEMGFQAFSAGLVLATPQSLIYTAIGSLTAPLINRNALKAQFMAANARQLEALYRYQKVILDGYVDVYNALLDLRNLEGVYGLKVREVEAMGRAVSASMDLFRAGKASYLEVLLAQQGALEVRLGLVELVRRRFEGAAVLWRALGGADLF